MFPGSSPECNLLSKSSEGKLCIRKLHICFLGSTQRKSSSQPTGTEKLLISNEFVSTRSQRGRASQLEQKVTDK